MQLPQRWIPAVQMQSQCRCNVVLIKVRRTRVSVPGFLFYARRNGLRLKPILRNIRFQQRINNLQEFRRVVSLPSWTLRNGLGWACETTRSGCGICLAKTLITRSQRIALVEKRAKESTPV